MNYKTFDKYNPFIISERRFNKEKVMCLHCGTRMMYPNLVIRNDLLCCPVIGCDGTIIDMMEDM